MRFKTSRFGMLDVDTDGMILFPDGLVGHPGHRHFVLLSEANNPAVGWLQSLSDAEFALAVVTPHRFVDKYALRVHRSQLASLPWAPSDRSVVLAIVSKNNGVLSLNLKAPLVINLDRCLGRQVVTADDQPVQHVLSDQPALLRKIA
ncbi:MAG TPA: flagellar assembly protein FliW [Pirellulaceae bacterium]